MKSLRHSLLALLMMASIAAWAQGIRDYMPNPATRLSLDDNYRQAVRKTQRKALDLKKAEDTIPQYLYYDAIVRRNSWLQGQGKPLTLEEAKEKKNVYYRLSLPTDGARYMHIEQMRGDSLIADSMLTASSQYLYDLISKSGEDPWNKRVGSIAQWLIAPSLDGKSVIEERAYDREGNMVYSLQPFPGSDGNIVVSFNNSWGYPVDFDEKKENFYGSVIEIKYDPNGYDGQIDYFDGLGLRKRNIKGVDQVRYVRDNEGNVKSVTYHNIVGDRMALKEPIVTDSLTFEDVSRVDFTYADDGNSTSITFYDKNDNPIYGHE